MPTYEYGCRTCGSIFDALRPIAERDAACACPGCGGPAPRVLFTAPALATLSSETRKAHGVNERSAHAPKYRSQCASGCGCAKHGKASTAPRGFANKRPWMISH